MSLKHNDLEGTIRDYITLDEFEPKSGDNDEVVVIGFYAKDQEPAQDLNTFIQRGTVEVIDTEVSPNPDINGDYIVFVEFRRDKSFPKLAMDLLTDVENLVGSLEWSATMANSPEKLTIDGDLLSKVCDNTVGTKEVTDGDSRAEIKVEESKILEFLKDSLTSGFTIDGECVIIEHQHRRIGAKIVGFGKESSLMESCGLTSAPIDFNYTPVEVTCLSNMLGGNFEVLKLNKNVVISKTGAEDILILSETQIING
jgi:hypothetical protein